MWNLEANSSNPLSNHQQGSHSVSSSSQGQMCSSSTSLSNGECHVLHQLGGSGEGTTIAVRGSITLTSSGRYLPSIGANQSLSLPLSYGEPPPSSSSCSTPTTPSTYTNLSSATPTLSSLLNTPSLHFNGNLLRSNSTSSSSSTPSPASSVASATCRTVPSHNSQHLGQQPPLPTMNKNKNIVAANPLLAGKNILPSSF